MSHSARRDVAYFDYRNFSFNYVPRSHPTAKSIIDAMQFPFLNGKTPLADRIGLSHLTLLTTGRREA